MNAQLYDPDCPPSYSTPANLDAPNRLPEIAAMSAKLGWELMPHQQHIAAVVTERTDDDLPAYWNATITLPRRNGKSALMCAMMIDRMLMWPKPQRVIYVAQTIADAAHLIADEWMPRLVESGLAKACGIRLFRSLNDLHLRASNGSVTRAIAMNSKASGHGQEVGLAIIDEAFAATDDSAETALRPALSTVPDSQLIVVSTAGHARSAYLKGRVDKGRRLLEEPGDHDRAAYIEWSADPTDNPYDEDVWRRAMPALGRTLTIERARADAADTSETIWRRSNLNQWVAAEVEPVFPRAVWRAVAQRDMMPTGGIVLGIDLPPDRSRGSIVACDADGIAEVVESKAGTDWLLPTAVRIAHRMSDVAGIAMLGGNMPTASLKDEIEASGVPHVIVGRNDYIAATGMLHDAVHQRMLRIYESQLYPRLRMAVEGAKKIGRGGFIWGQEDLTCDITPLVALTLAHWAARRSKIELAGTPIVGDYPDEGDARQAVWQAAYDGQTTETDDAEMATAS